MRILPITISADLIPPTLTHRKQRTRRIIRPKSQEDYALMINMETGCNVEESIKELTRTSCPWDVGDILYVREEHYLWGCWDIDVAGATMPTGRKKTRFVDWTGTVLFPNTFGYNVKVDRDCMGWHKRLARFMPKKYARIFLEVKDRRVERLQDITGAESILEGIEGGPVTGWKDYSAPYYCIKAMPRESFQTLWEKINGPGSWQENNWVWVISFKRVDKPANFLNAK